MAKHRRTSDQNKLKQRLGQGHGEDYKPFLTVRDFASQGLSHRIQGHKHNRTHHLFSNHEKNYFLLLEWSDLVIDIREQFPLDLQETQSIAERLGIKHPTDPKSQTPSIMTTDFLIDVLVDGDTVYKARSIKPSKDLGSRRTIEKLEIERTYWTEKKIDWAIVTEREIPKEKYDRVAWVYDANDFGDGPIADPQSVPQIESALLSEINAFPERPLSQVALTMDKMLGLKGGSCLWLARHLIATKQWKVSLEDIAPEKPLHIYATKNHQIGLA